MVNGGWLMVAGHVTSLKWMVVTCPKSGLLGIHAELLVSLVIDLWLVNGGFMVAQWLMLSQWLVVGWVFKLATWWVDHDRKMGAALQQLCWRWQAVHPWLASAVDAWITPQRNQAVYWCELRLLTYGKRVPVIPKTGKIKGNIGGLTYHPWSKHSTMIHH